MEQAPGQCANRDWNGAIVGRGLPGGPRGRVASARGDGHDGSTRRADRADRSLSSRQLTRWERAATTPQRLARRARIILGGAAGLGSRRLAHQQHTESDNGAALARALSGGRLRRAAGSTAPWPADVCSRQRRARWWWHWRANDPPTVACRSAAIAWVNSPRKPPISWASSAASFAQPRLALVEAGRLASLAPSVLDLSA